MSILRTKSIEQSIEDADEPEYQLKKSLSALDLTVFGIGVIIGAGIFTLTGAAAKDYAGPAVAISFTIAAICCAFAALCYAEFAAAVPVSGSAYTFSYATLGEMVAWIIGWDLILELMLGRVGRRRRAGARTPSSCSTRWASPGRRTSGRVPTSTCCRSCWSPH